VTEAELARHAERLLAAHALPNGDARVVAALLARCEVRRLGTGEVLFREADRALELLFMLDGRARALKRDHTGHDREIGSWFPPALLGTLAVVGGSGPDGAGTRSATCIIAAPSLIAALDGETTRWLLGEASAEGAHLRWLLLATAAETLADTTIHLREALASASASATAPDSGPVLDRLQALIERAQS
jgi:CRP-like cAMP-binding protein